jgi:hypothetical protein
MKSLAALLICAVTLTLAGARFASSGPAATGSASPLVYLPYIAGDRCGPRLDTFDGPLTDWFVGQDGSLSAEIVNGEYRLRIDDPGTVWLVPGPLCGRAAYRAAVDARWAGDPGNFIGLQLDIDDATQSAYLFVINTDHGVWLVFESRPGSLQTVIPPTADAAIRSGDATNRLAAERTATALHLSINDIPVGQLAVAAPAAPVVTGVVAAAYTTQSTADARFDNFLWSAAPATNSTP